MPKIIQISTTTVVIGSEPVTTVTALLDDGRIIYTGTGGDLSKWHELDPPRFNRDGKLLG